MPPADPAGVARAESDDAVGALGQTCVAVEANELETPSEDPTKRITTRPAQ
jgi:hypothetical protein